MEFKCLLVFFDKFNTSFFTASITLGAFLLSMKTFIIQIMKSEVYDKDSYKRNIEKINSSLPDNKKIQRYKPLSHLKIVLTATIYISFLTALLQLVATLFPKKWLIYTSLLGMLVTFICVFIAIFLVSGNLKKLLAIKDD